MPVRIQEAGPSTHEAPATLGGRWHANEPCKGTTDSKQQLLSSLESGLRALVGEEDFLAS